MALTSSTSKQSNDAITAEYTSRMVRQYTQWLSRLRFPQLLDIGPICGENINYFIHFSGKVYVCDLFIRIGRIPRRPAGADRAAACLDYPRESFDGLHIWDLLDHLEDDEAISVIERAVELLKIGGRVVITAYDEHITSPPVSSFVIQPESRIILRPQPHLSLPYTFRSNRDLTALLSPLTLVGSYVYRSGIREFLFERQR
jgi:hypothetical protein